MDEVDKLTCVALFSPHQKTAINLLTCHLNCVYEFLRKWSSRKMGIIGEYSLEDVQRFILFIYTKISSLF